MSRAKRLAIVGYGTVGSGVYEALEENREKVEKLVGGFTIPLIVVKDGKKSRTTESGTKISEDIETLYKEEIDTAVEAVPDALTAYPIVKKLLEKGITVVTANKELIAKYGEELLHLAAENDCRLYFEAAVAGGIPVLSSIRHTLKVNNVEKIEGIVNGTSNFILTKMREEGTSFEDALEEAQRLGYAEALPDKDVDGWDAWYKTVILSHWLHGQPPVWPEEKPRGIRGIDVRDLHLAAAFYGRIKHTAVLEGTSARVEPRFVDADHPLYGVEGVNNGIHVKGSIVGSLLFQGAGAGKFPTASAVIEDIVNHWTNTAEAEPPYTEQRKEQETKEQDNFPYWFITGEHLQDLPDLVSEVRFLEGKEAAVLKCAREDLPDVSGTVYPVSGTLKEGKQLAASPVLS
ncbi:homoserine dehydrogenase [Alkalicoccus halolimnae]|uniref:Homoserine dehydrogenase n=1 Tax=Alkalicoccus halolimnae TaxID=1667239 RepID=A0A5C7F2H9_9BACI|nr:homoserine dehydrogenase [Alkalicoccus halolimnae]TXF84296.1 homoserine dehydrogenase [Alkalicoccus halolimnae]